MPLWEELARAALSGDEILLRKRGQIYEIRYNGLELMSNRSVQSETVLALRSLRFARKPCRVLIGGLGMGFTLRTVLDSLPADAEVTVCELVPEIAGWHEEHIGHLCGHPLRDRRVELRIADVIDVLEAELAAYDVILMDTDNGPDFTVRSSNLLIYENRGLAAAKRAVRPGGVVSFWSAATSIPFEQTLEALGWAWRREEVLLPGGRADAFHYIYLTAPHDAGDDSLALPSAGRRQREYCTVDEDA